jgi:ubiquinone/menaquinone biosynthesis C-methylase UbiE
MQKRCLSGGELATCPTNYREWHQFVREREFLTVLEQFPAGHRFANALELGAGDGSQSEIIAKHCHRLTCTELEAVSDTLLGAFQARNLPNVDYQLCDARDLSRFADASFDFVFSSNMLEHVDGLRRCLTECRRVLAPGGIMIHIMPSRHWKLWNAIVSVLCHRMKPKIHGLSQNHWQEWKSFGVASWKKEFSGAGLQVTKVIGLPFYFGHGPNPKFLIRLGNALGWHGSVAYFVEGRK